MKRILSFVLVLSFLVTFVGAVDEVYEVGSDTQISLMSTGYDVAVTAVEPSDLNNLFELYFRTPTGLTLGTIVERIAGYIRSSGSYLGASGSTLSGSLVSVGDLVRNGFLGLAETIKDYSSSSSVSSIYSLLIDYVPLIDSGIDTSNGYLEQIAGRLMSNSSSFFHSNGTIGTTSSPLTISVLLNNGFLGLRTLLTQVVGVDFLYSNGALATNTDPNLSFTYYLRNGLLGLSRGIIRQVDGTTWNYLGQQGRLAEVTYRGTLFEVTRAGFAGIRSLISGQEADNVYNVSLLNNENLTETSTATGLGPMLQAYLGEIQQGTGLLSYVFASPQDLELKKDSESNMAAVGDSLLSPDSSSSVKVSDITDISSASDSIQSLGETGVTPGQAFDQLGNADLFSFFTEETASNLDTTVSTFSADSSQQIVTHYYEENRIAFFDILTGEED